jgi:uncharacterized damage-inducible protein DinB
MRVNDIFIDGYTRIQELVHMATAGLDVDQLMYRPEPGANSIAWLVWHLSRVQDDHVSEIAGIEQLWSDADVRAATGIDRDPGATGYGDGPDDVAAIRPASVEALVAFHDAVIARTMTYLDGMDAEDLDRIIDRSWDPPVSVGVRLVSVISDNIQHAGQARYLNGIIGRIG